MRGINCTLQEVAIQDGKLKYYNITRILKTLWRITIISFTRWFEIKFGTYLYSGLWPIYIIHIHYMFHIESMKSYKNKDSGFTFH